MEKRMSRTNDHWKLCRDGGGCSWRCGVVDLIGFRFGNAEGRIGAVDFGHFGRERFGSLLVIEVFQILRSVSVGGRYK